MVEVRYLEEYTFVLMKDAESSQTLLSNSNKELTIDLELFTLTLKAKGKIDPYLVSYICSRLNYKHNLKLFSILFATFKNQEFKTIYTEVYGDVALVSSQQQKRFSFSKEKYLKFRQILVSSIHKDPKSLENLFSLISEIESDLCTSLMDGNKKHLHYLEKLLIGMMGHPEESIRNAAITYLNVLYDEVDWQLRGGFKPKIKCVGDEFKLEYLIESDPEDNNTICFQLNAPPLISIQQKKPTPISPQSSTALGNRGAENIHNQVISWHKPRIIDLSSFLGYAKEYKEMGKYIVVSLDLGQFTKCGFYDWKLVKIQKNGKVKGLYKVYDLKELTSKTSLSNLVFDNRSYKCKPIHGRFIVHPAETHSLQIHEVFVDMEGNKQKNPAGETKTQPIRGSFNKIREQITNYKNMGINCLYLMGALERDNGMEYNASTGQKSFLRPNASCLAITCRKTPCSMLGGGEAFTSLCDEAAKNDVKIMIDCLTKVSSSRPHKKYRNCFLYTLDDEGKRMVCFGTDGRSINYEDTALLNYRKKKVWDLLISELTEICSIYPINGIHLENAQAWPQIHLLDIKEMYRKDPDNTAAYTEKEIFNGEVVLQDENCGYWASETKHQYANPFLIKICKNLWAKFPNFLIVAETWGGKGFEGREFNIVKSGPIPRMFDLPIALSTLYGKRLRRDGNIVPCEKTNMNIFQSWYENIKKYMPKGSILIQSTTSNIWPYPVTLYKRAALPIVDLFFLLPDIPMTFIGENDGETARIKAANIFTRISIKGLNEKDGKEEIKSQKISKKSKNTKKEEESEEEELMDVYSEHNINFVDIKKMKMSMSNKQMHMAPLQFQFNTSLQYQTHNREKKSKEKGGLKKTKSEKKIELEKGLNFLKEDDEIINASDIAQTPQKFPYLERKQSGGIFFKVSSGVSISDLGIQQLKLAEEILQKENNVEQPLDLKQIGRFFFLFKRN